MGRPKWVIVYFALWGASLPEALAPAGGWPDIHCDVAEHARRPNAYTYMCMYNIPDIIIIYTYIIYYNNVKTDYYQRERERDVLSNILYGPLYSIYYNNNACTQTKSHAQTSLYLPWATAALSFHRHAPTWHEQTWAIAACHLGDCSVSSSHPKTGRTWERY